MSKIIQHLSFPICKESACNAGDPSSIPGLERSPAEGKGYPVQYSGLENSMDYIVCGVAKSWTQLSDFHIWLSSLSIISSRSIHIAAFCCWIILHWIYIYIYIYNFYLFICQWKQKLSSVRKKDVHYSYSWTFLIFPIDSMIFILK